MLPMCKYGRSVAFNITKKQLVKYDWTKLIGKNVYRNNINLGKLTKHINLIDYTAIVESLNKDNNMIEKKEINLIDICTWEKS